MLNESFSLNIFFSSGITGKPITATIPGRTSVIGDIKREEVESFDSKDITKPGIYMLFCFMSDNTEAIYIGQAENLKARFLSHISSYPKTEKFYWHTALFISDDYLDASRRLYIENYLTKLAKRCNRYKVLTKSTNKVGVNEQLVAELEIFLYYAIPVLNLLGQRVFEPLPIQTSVPAKTLGTIEQMPEKASFISLQRQRAINIIEKKKHLALLPLAVRGKRNTKILEDKSCSYSFHCSRHSIDNESYDFFFTMKSINVPYKHYYVLTFEGRSEIFAFTWDQVLAIGKTRNSFECDLKFSISKNNTLRSKNTSKSLEEYRIDF